MFKNPYILGAIAIAFLLAQKGSEKTPTGCVKKNTFPGMPGNRGVRNNNPGNLRISKSNWVGKIPVSQNTDCEFEQFYEWRYGVRAMIKLLQNYIASGHNTISKIVSRYAPSTENPTNNYIAFVEQETGINRNAIIGSNNLYKVVDAMAQRESNVRIPYSLYIEALNL